jgi:CopA family copper-resistance protein
MHPVSRNDWNFKMLSRRKLLQTAPTAGALLATHGLLPAWARSGDAGVARSEFDLAIRQQTIPINGKPARVTTVDGSLPGTLLRMREGDDVVLRVRNELDEDTSLHWHGILLPPEMDGVPGISFDGVAPGETFEYRFRVNQNGTYWYHSHSGFQEQLGVYAPLIIEPRGSEPVPADRELVIVLSDWSFDDPARIYAKLKKNAEYYNRRRATLADLRGRSDQLDWERMRMMRSDISDVTGVTYTYLLNGHGPEDDWTGLFEAGERVRLRVINASAMTYFNFRIPGLPLQVIQADGQDLVPVTVDEVQIAVAETMDMVVEPKGDRAYTIVAESMDRTGMAVGRLTPSTELRADVPPLRAPPERTMADMGHGGHAAMGHAGHGEVDHAAMGHGAMDHSQHGAMDHSQHGAKGTAPGHDGMNHGMNPPGKTPVSPTPWTPRRGPGVANIVDSPMSRLMEPGTGLSDMDHRVLTYADMRAREPFYDQRPPAREIWLHLTGNMERYMWSFDGVNVRSRMEPVVFEYGERVRLVFINHTMMEHPIHLHGMWMELENGQVPMPRKHTVSVKPAERLSVLVSADASGSWAFHCHLLLHMKAGMMRTVVVGEPAAEVRRG